MDPLLPLSEARPASVKMAERLLAVLGNPQDRLAVVHVAGTNGKGSTCAMIESVLRHAGYRTGLYTSPHLWLPGERIRIDGHPMATAALVALIEQDVLPAARAAGIVPTEFEVYTAAALLAFARAGVDVAVVEVGLGGRIDATNVVSPHVSVITSIGFDHVDKLGDSLTAIARQKAGIVKPGAPVVTGVTGEALAVIEAQAAQCGVPCLTVAEAACLGWDGAGQQLRFQAREVSDLDGDYGLPLLGEHQLRNAALALQTLAVMTARLPVSRADAVRGIAGVRWPGRMERVVALGAEWLFDGAHNAEGVEVLASALARHFPGRRLGLVFGVMRDKPWQTMAAGLATLAEAVWLTPVPSERSETVEQLATIPWTQPPTPCANYAEALFAAWRWSDRPAARPLILVSGSLSLVGACRAYLGLD